MPVHVKRPLWHLHNPATLHSRHGAFRDPNDSSAHLIIKDWGFWYTNSAKTNRAFSPPEKGLTASKTLSPRKSKPPKKLRKSFSVAVYPAAVNATRDIHQCAVAPVDAGQNSRFLTLPLHSFLPDKGCISPASTLIKLDFPAPFGPNSPIRSPGDIDSPACLITQVCP